MTSPETNVGSPVESQPENPITGMLRDGGDPRGRSFAAVATSGVIHLSLAGVLVFASAFAVAPPPPARTTRVVCVIPGPQGAPPPLARKGVKRPEATKPPEVKPTPAPVRHVSRTPTLAAPLPAQPSEPADEIEGIPEGDVRGVLGGELHGHPDGILGSHGDTPGAPPGDFPLSPETIAIPFEQARLISKVDPIYPVIGKKSGTQGVVVLEAIIDTDGSVSEVSVLRSIPLLDDAAITAVRQWRFEPGFRDGRPVRQRLTVSVSFRLNR